MQTFSNAAQALRSASILLVAAVAFAAPAAAQTKKDPTKIDGRLVVEDGAGLFTTDAIKKAREELADIKDRIPREMYVLTYKELTAAQKAEFEKFEKAGKLSEFWTEWEKRELRALKARGVALVIYRNPDVIKVYADRQTRDQGFTVRDEELIERDFREKMKQAKDKPEAEQAALRDKALLNAVEFVHDAYKKMVR